MITLSKALKVKNRLAGKLAKLQEQIAKYNTVTEDKTSSISIEALWNEYNEVRLKLIELKSKLAEATAGVSFALVALSETKSTIKFLESLDIKEGKDTISVGHYAAAVVKEVEYKSYMNELARQKELKSLQESAEKFQDQIDEFNATTKIDF